MLVENPVKITETQIKKMAKLARGRITTIYLHWTAGHYGQVFDDYHLCIDQDCCVLVSDTRISTYYNLWGCDKIAI